MNKTPISIACSTSLAMLAKTLGNSLGVEVVIGGDQAATDGKTVYLPSTAVDGTPASALLLVQYLHHEAGHLAYTDFAAVKAAAKDGPAVKSLQNILEDPRIERRHWARWPGAQAILDRMVKDMVDSGGFKVSPPEAKLAHRASFAILYHLRARVNGQEAVGEIAGAMSAQMAEVLGSLLWADILREAEGAVFGRTSWDTLESARRILKVIQDAGEEETPEEAGDSGNSGDSGDAGEPGGAGAAGDDGDAGGPGGSGDAGEPGGPGGAGAGTGNAGAKALADSFGDMTSEDADDIVESADAGSIMSQAINKDAAKNRGVFGGKPGSAGRGVSDGVPRETFRGGAPVSENHLRKAELVSNGVRSALETALLDHVRVGRRFSDQGGRMATGRMTRAKFGETRLWAARAVKPEYSSAVSILLDVSGSMGTTDLETATLCALAIGDALQGLDEASAGSVACSITGFDDEVHPIVEFDEEWQQGRWNLQRVRALGGTAYGQALLHAAAPLLARDEECKLCVIVTDGQPADPAEFVTMRRHLEREGVPVYGLIIGGGVNPALFGDRGRVLAGIRELPQAISEVLLREVVV